VAVGAGVAVADGTGLGDAVVTASVLVAVGRTTVARSGVLAQETANAVANSSTNNSALRFAITLPHHFNVVFEAESGAFGNGDEAVLHRVRHFQD
jgi:hypothetical protein